MTTRILIDVLRFSSLISLALVTLTLYESPPPIQSNLYQNSFSLIPLAFWISLFIAFPSLFLLSYVTERQFEKLACSVAFVLLIIGPSYLYQMFGPDNGMLGIYERYIESGVRTSQSSYFDEWPVFAVLGKMLLILVGISHFSSLRILFLAVVVTTVSSLYLFFSRVNRKTCSVGVFVSFMTFYVFLNWQIGAQTLAFGIFLLILNLLRPDRRFLGLSFVSFLTLSFTHGIVVFWVILLVSGLAAAEIFARQHPHFVQYMKLAVTFAAIQFTVMMYHSIRYFGSFVRVFNPYALLLRTEELTQHQIVGYAELSYGTGQELLIQTVARANFIFSWFILVVAFVLELWRLRIAHIELATFFTTGIHLTIGCAFLVYGLRALQLLCPVMPRVLLRSISSSKRNKIFISLLCCAVIFFPFNVMNNYYDYTLYQSRYDYFAGRFSVMFSRDLGTFLSDGVNGGYVSTLSKYPVDFMNPRTLDQRLMRADFFLYILAGPKLYKELQRFGGLSDADVLGMLTQWIRTRNKIYDSGLNAWYTTFSMSP